MGKSEREQPEIPDGVDPAEFLKALLGLSPIDAAEARGDAARATQADAEGRAVPRTAAEAREEAARAGGDQPGGSAGGSED